MRKIFLIFLFITLFSSAFISTKKNTQDERFITYKVDLNENEVKFYWQDERNNNFKSIENLKTWLENKNQELVFATNGGMYQKDGTPQGLFIENFIEKKKLDIGEGNGNFYLKPNGIFYITNDKKAIICKTENFKIDKKIKYATQSGPMLVIENKIHKAFKKESQNMNIRNGVGVLENGEVIFVMSKNKINFYDFASYFKVIGCKNALYLDGFVSRTFLPEKKWIQTDGNFGVIIGITKNK